MEFNKNKNMKINVPYLDPALKPEERVADLMERMTLEEKSARLMVIWNGGVERFKPSVI